MTESLRQIPSVHEILESPQFADIRRQFPREEIVQVIRTHLELVRQLLKKDATLLDGSKVIDYVKSQFAVSYRREYRPVINATGIVLHTNLGRAPLAEQAAKAVYEVARHYTNLEMDLRTGQRSSRQELVRKLLVELTGAESATVVNNCAAATILVLRSLAKDREVIVSRGQLIEIGGSFRIPEIMAVSGAILREVGTTNITRLKDYELAITPATAALMRIHTSNYRVQGFTAIVGLEELVALARRQQIRVIDDVGSGLLFDLPGVSLSGEPRVKESLARGADVVLCSGDKLLGGPQAGLIFGKKSLIERMESDPLMRAFRVDKMTLAALHTTLRMYRSPSFVVESIPIFRMISAPADRLKARAEQLAQRLSSIPGISVEVQEDVSYVGGGSLPEEEIPTWIVSLRCDWAGDSELSQRLRLGKPAVVGRLREGRLVLDLRTIFPEQEQDVVDAIRVAVESLKAKPKIPSELLAPSLDSDPERV
jgi:L-seryl-tRNA(Ser) seleniumtransferase